MHSHGPSCLQGPVRRTREWWMPRTLAREGTSLLRGREESTMNDPVKEPRQPHGSIRHDLVERVRRDIAAGTYDTPERWEAALERLLQELEEEE